MLVLPELISRPHLPECLCKKWEQALASSICSQQRLCDPNKSRSHLLAAVDAWVERIQAGLVHTHYMPLQTSLEAYGNFDQLQVALRTFRNEHKEEELLIPLKRELRRLRDRMEQLGIACGDVDPFEEHKSFRVAVWKFQQAFGLDPDQSTHTHTTYIHTLNTHTHKIEREESNLFPTADREMFKLILESPLRGGNLEEMASIQEETLCLQIQNLEALLERNRSLEETLERDCRDLNRTRLYLTQRAEASQGTLLQSSEAETKMSSLDHSLGQTHDTLRKIERCRCPLQLRLGLWIWQSRSNWTATRIWTLGWL